MVHVAWPAKAEYVPGAHAVAIVEPVAHAEPVGHVVQLPALVRPAVFENEPAGQGSGAAAAVLQ